MIHFSSTSGMGTVPDCTPSRSLRAPSVPSSYTNGGLPAACANSCAAGSRT
ncbi:hypothetical protein ACFQ0B_39955 [Nonomuraea thailandensis]